MGEGALFFQNPHCFYEIQKVHKKPICGVINGLYATTNGGGGIVPIQIFSNFYNNDSPFSLRLTGCQGDVMKESMTVAKTLAWSLTPEDKQKELTKHFEETKSKIAEKIIFDYKNAINNFYQVCPKEMLDKLDNPITIKDKINIAI